MSNKVLKVLPFLTVAFLAVSRPSPFEPVLKILNDEPKGEKLAFTTPIEKKLRGEYMEEMRQIKVGLPPLEKKQLNVEIEKKVKVANEKALSILKKSSRMSELNIDKTIQKVFKELTSNRVSKVEAVTKYDKLGDIGFCFGRAAFVHYLLLTEGIPAERIAKLFALGKLRYNEQLWDFHMATAVENEKGVWWVIDSLFPKPMPLDDWVEETAKFDSRISPSHVRFYVTDPRKFQPDYGRYSSQDFQIPELKSYFEDLFKSVRK